MLNNFKNILSEKGEVYLRIKARPNAARSNITDVQDDEMKVDIAAPAEKGKANIELIKLLAKEFGIDKKNIKIISGANSRIKLVKLKQ